MRRAWPVAIAIGLAAGAARADGTTWFDGGSRELGRGRSASTEAPVSEYVYGPRPELALGFDLDVLRAGSTTRAFRVGFSALARVQGRDDHGIFPTHPLWRDVEALTFAWARRGSFGADDITEFALALGHDGAHAANGDVSVSGYRSRDIPFGGGGYWLGVDLAIDVPVSARFVVTTRLGDRIFTNAFPAMFGVREASNVVADTLSEGLLHAPWAEVDVRFRASPKVVPFVSLFGASLVAHDSSAQNGVVLHAIVGVGLPARLGEFAPFVRFDAGNGEGLFVNQRQLGTSIGVRYATFLRARFGALRRLRGAPRRRRRPPDARRGAARDHRRDLRAPRADGRLRTRRPVRHGRRVAPALDPDRAAKRRLRNDQSIGPHRD